MNRYDRQIPVIGTDGQERLKKARVLIAGAGGLGTVISAYLCLAGVGFMRIVDSDTVEESNLNRQFLNLADDIGKSKAHCIQERLSLMNPGICIEALRETITEANACSLAGTCDIIIDALDNFTARFLLNRAAFELDIPFIHGAVQGYYGQSATIVPGRTACLRCMFPQSPSGEKVPVIGTTCGIIGSMQANEAIKHLCRIEGGQTPGRLLLWDGLRGDMNILEISRDPSCSDCHPENRSDSE
ncbi:MAG TPA: HesA/MoeB/ThiF family protein [Deltaproteobacteria bacterium]|nr:HesA/MoeB/ThiF family protein [Deltaproteobacteria bacterium]